MMSVRGGDAAGDAVAPRSPMPASADLSAVFLDRATPSYTALLDRKATWSPRWPTWASMNSPSPSRCGARSCARRSRGRCGAVRRQSARRGLGRSSPLAAGKARLCHRHLARQGDPDCRDPVGPGLPVPQPARGSGAGLAAMAGWTTRLVKALHARACRPACSRMGGEPSSPSIPDRSPGSCRRGRAGSSMSRARATPLRAPRSQRGRTGSR